MSLFSFDGRQEVVVFALNIVRKLVNVTALCGCSVKFNNLSLFHWYFTTL